MKNIVQMLTTPYNSFHQLHTFSTFSMSLCPGAQGREKFPCKEERRGCKYLLGPIAHHMQPAGLTLLDLRPGTGERLCLQLTADTTNIQSQNVIYT